MYRKKYYYNAQTCQYEKVNRNKKYYVGKFLVFSMLVLSSALGILYSYTYYSATPKEKKLLQKNTLLTQQIKHIQNEIAEVNQILQELQKKDDHLYRTIFEISPLDTTIRKAGIGGTDPHQNINKDAIIVNTIQNIQQLKQQLYIQSKSFIRLIKIAEKKKEQWQCIPLMQPITKKDLKKLASGFGIRNDPFIKVKKMHQGIDLVAIKGTPIYAPGNGIVKLVNQSSSYGKQIEINHGFGYVTKYAHLHKWHVKKGQKIKRGQLIAEVGNTGRSQGPHLHYEIIKKGKKINPMLYFILNQITPQEYHQAFHSSLSINQSLD